MSEEKKTELTPEQARANREHCLAQCEARVTELRAVCQALSAAEDAVHHYAGDKGFWWSQRLADMHQQARDAIHGLEEMIARWAKTRYTTTEVVEPEAPD